MGGLSISIRIPDLKEVQTRTDLLLPIEGDFLLRRLPWFDVNGIIELKRDHPAAMMLSTSLSVNRSPGGPSNSSILFYVLSKRIVVYRTLCFFVF